MDIKKVSPAEFRATLQVAKKGIGIKDAWRVDIHSEQEYLDVVNEGGSLYTTAEGSTFAIKADGDIISLCRHGKTDSGRKILAEAVLRGGRKLDSYLGNLEFYQRNGFELIATTTAILDYMEEFQLASKKVVGMGEKALEVENVGAFCYVGEGLRKYENYEDFAQANPQRTFTGESGYDQMIATRDNILESSR